MGPIGCLETSVTLCFILIQDFTSAVSDTRASDLYSYVLDFNMFRNAKDMLKILKSMEHVYKLHTTRRLSLLCKSRSKCVEESSRSVT